MEAVNVTAVCEPSTGVTTPVVGLSKALSEEVHIMVVPSKLVGNTNVVAVS